MTGRSRRTPTLAPYTFAADGCTYLDVHQAWRNALSARAFSVVDDRDGVRR